MVAFETSLFWKSYKGGLKPKYYWIFYNQSKG